MLKLLYIYGFLFYCCCTYANIRLPRLISDGMVLQRNEKINLWGYGNVNEKIVITFKQKLYKTIVNEKGKWQVTIPPQQHGGPYVMLLKGQNEIILNNLLIGDVWICGGQSNMELNMERLKDQYPDVYQSAYNPMIRTFIAPKQYDFNEKRIDYDGGEWISVDVHNIKKFSSVAYFFADSIFKATKIPIGLINIALGGSPAQAWISEAGLKTFSHYTQSLKHYKKKSFIDSIILQNQIHHSEWYHAVNATDRGLIEDWHLPEIDRRDWDQCIMPNDWKNCNQTIGSGTIWIHKKFYLTKAHLQESCILWMGCIVDADSTYINGVLIGNTTYQYPPRKYSIAPSILKEGENEITIRIFDEYNHGGLIRDKHYMLHFEDGNVLSLQGDWQYKVGAQVAQKTPQHFIQWQPSGLYNAMLHPLFQYPIKGILWYQGESNTAIPEEYADLMHALIEEWRYGWKNKKLPFYFVQLANFMESNNAPTESKWAALRQKQLECLSIPHTGMAVAIDVGEWNDIHPLNKKTIGQRLALHALKNDYGYRNLIASGPILQEALLKGNRVELTFDQTDFKEVDGENLFHFELASNDRIFHKAYAIIERGKVVVGCRNVANPFYVRYAWSDNPGVVNFYNQSGLPASPFEATVMRD